MNSTNHNPDLSRSLARHADQFARRGGSELEIDQVLARAGEIRRGRRMRATLVMAAVVAAIVVPVGIVSVGNDASERPSPATPPDNSALTLDGLRTGAVPKIGFGLDHEWRGPDQTVDLSGLADKVVEVAPLESGLLVATQNTDSGELTANFVTPDGIITGEARPMDWGFAVSEDGNVGAFVQPDGTPVAIQDGGTAYELPRIPRGSGFAAVAVTGEDCEPRAENTACSVWVASRGEKPETWVSSTSGEAVTARPDFLTVTDVLDGERVAGITDVSDSGSCSAVAAFDREDPQWTTCEYRFLAYSPDGTRLLASAAYADGLGDTQLTILDAGSGEVELDLSTVQEATITQMVWEDDSHLLAKVYELGRWAILRIGLDGSREYAVAPVTGFEDVDSPFVLPAR